MIDEPLFVIHQADSIVSLSGQNILSGFKQLLLPSNHSRPSADVTVNVDEEIDEFSVQYFYGSAYHFTLIFLNNFIQITFPKTKHKYTN
jgi:hypothetical protein